MGRRKGRQWVERKEENGLKKRNGKKEGKRMCRRKGI